MYKSGSAWVRNRGYRSCEGAEGDAIEAPPQVRGVLRHPGCCPGALRAQRQGDLRETRRHRVQQARRPAGQEVLLFSPDPPQTQPNCSHCSRGLFRPPDSSNEATSGSYCRKGSAHQQTPLPPRLLRLPRTTSSSTNRSSSPSGGTPRSPPTASVGFECSILTHEEAAADKSSSARRGKSRSAASSSGAVSSSRHQSGRHKGWKNPGGKSRTAAEARFLIKEAAAAATAAGDSPSSSSYRDTRTTVMIKNIPNKYRSARFPLPFVALWRIFFS